VGYSEGQKMKFSFLLFAIDLMLKYKAWRYPFFKSRLKEKNLTAQIKVMDDSEGRFFTFAEGKIASKKGVHPRPDVVLTFSNATLASRLLLPSANQLERINAMKNFEVELHGPDELTQWFLETLSLAMAAGTEYGTALGNGSRRYVSSSAGMPVFVFVKEGKIVRVTSIDFDQEDAKPWTIQARGKTFTPPRKTTLSPYAYASKSIVYSPDRLLYPMKRVDFDPHGERHCENRGISGFERISWNEALDIVAREIRRVKRDYGPGAILTSTGSHHMWGSIGYYLSAHRRFAQAVGMTPVVQNPDSWEGWYWGAMHHWGNSMHLGCGEPYGTVEDALKECEMMVFWASDP
jgi:trimethylamine-N-oxide reductase (cytochrome c)